MNDKLRHQKEHQQYLLCEGVYEIKDGSHKGYAALWVNNNENILAYNSITGNDYANAIHFHMAGKLNKDHPGDGSYSQGCITVPVSEYAEFGVRVGFINEDANENIGKNHKYQEAKGKLPYGEYMKDFEGHMVIDRQYYEDSGGYLKFNGQRGKSNGQTEHFERAAYTIWHICGNDREGDRQEGRNARGLLQYG